MDEEKYDSYSFWLDRTARKVKQYAQQQFTTRNFNLTVDQWIILKHLYQKGAMKQNELAELVAKDNPTLTRIIDLLCKKNFVQRKVHPTDRRSFIVSLTEEGNQVVNDLSPDVKEIRLKAWQGLSDDDFKKFQNILSTIYKNLD